MELRRLWWTLVGVVVCAAMPAQAGIWIGHGPNQGIYTLAIDPTTPDTLYCGGDSGGVYKSTDGGSSWTPVNSGLPNSSVRALLIDPTSTTTIYAGTAGSSVYKTTDGGASWSPANGGLAGNVTALVINPFLPSLLYAGTSGGGVYQSSDSGTSWMQRNVGLTNNNVTTLVIDPLNPSRLYAGTQGGGAFATANGGLNWGAANSGVYETLPSVVNALVLDPVTPTTVYAATSGGVFTSIFVPNWDNINTGLFVGISVPEVRALAIDPQHPGTLYAATASGIFRRTDRDPSWTPLSAGLTSHDVSVLAVDPANSSAVYAGSNSTGVFVQTQLCTAVPKTGCWLTFVANKSVLTLKDKSSNKQDSLMWKWLKGEADAVGDYGDPLTTNHYSLCIYDESGISPQLLLGVTAPAGGNCGPKAKPCWKTTAKGFKYKDQLRAADGMDSIALTAGGDGKAQATVSLKGITLPMPTLPLNLPLRVQLQSLAGNCWETHFSTVLKNQADQFDARSD